MCFTKIHFLFRNSIKFTEKKGLGVWRKAINDS